MTTTKIKQQTNIIESYNFADGFIRNEVIKYDAMPT